MIRLILAILDVVVTFAVIWIGHMTGKRAEQFATPDNELVYYMGALVAVMLAGAFGWTAIRYAVFKR